MQRDFKIKVCGMKYRDNVEDAIRLGIDYIGFIFYKKSKRYIESKVPGVNYEKTEKVGVFVNEPIEDVSQIAKTNKLDVIQLHGEETVDYCRQLKDIGYKVWKVFSIDSHFEFKVCQGYNKEVDMFLFDTKGVKPGGNGVRFNWNVLERYELDIPFLLSGGIRSSHAEDILAFNHNRCTGIDINSGFEINPGRKDINEIKNFMEKLKY